MFVNSYTSILIIFIKPCVINGQDHFGFGYFILFDDKEINFNVLSCIFKHALLLKIITTLHPAFHLLRLLNIFPFLHFSPFHPAPPHSPSSSALLLRSSGVWSLLLLLLCHLTLRCVPSILKETKRGRLPLAELSLGSRLFSSLAVWNSHSGSLRWPSEKGRTLFSPHLFIYYFRNTLNNFGFCTVISLDLFEWLLAADRTLDHLKDARTPASLDRGVNLIAIEM